MEKLMFPLFRVNGRCASAPGAGAHRGYPVGARRAELYKNGQYSRTEAGDSGLLQQLRPCLSVGGGGHSVSLAAPDRAAIVHPHDVPPLLVGLVFRFYRAQSEPPHLRLSAPGTPAHIHPPLSLPNLFGTAAVRSSMSAPLLYTIWGDSAAVDPVRHSGLTVQRAGSPLLPPGPQLSLGQTAAGRSFRSCPTGWPPLPAETGLEDSHGRLSAGLGRTQRSVQTMRRASGGLTCP